MSRLSSLTLAQLRPLLTAIGSRTSGTKPDLLATLERDIKIPLLESRSDRKATRILSVDMGIKNLAFCVCDVNIVTEKQRARQSIAVEMNVRDWKRIAVMGLASSSSTATNVLDEGGDPFTPQALSKLAYALVKQIWMPYRADVVLIERQRFRSGGGSAVQEWTLRVNMLESMIWAMFTAIRGENESADGMKVGESKCPEVRAVSPKQVANFWVGSGGGGGASVEGKSHYELEKVKKGTKTKIEKKQKIDLVQTWLAGHGRERLKLDFSGEAARMKDAYLHALARGVGGSRKKVPKMTSGVSGGENDDSAPATTVTTTVTTETVEKISKLDDLADSLLQAAAWCTWEDNRRSLLPLLLRDDAPDQVVAWLDKTNGKS